MKIYEYEMPPSWPLIIRSPCLNPKCQSQQNIQPVLKCHALAKDALYRNDIKRRRENNHQKYFSPSSPWHQSTEFYLVIHNSPPHQLSITSLLTDHDDDLSKIIQTERTHPRSPILITTTKGSLRGFFLRQSLPIALMSSYSTEDTVVLSRS